MNNRMRFALKKRQSYDPTDTLAERYWKRLETMPRKLRVLKLRAILRQGRVHKH